LNRTYTSFYDFGADDVDMLDDSNVPVEDEKDLCQEIQQNAAQNEDKSNNKPSTSKADAGDQHFNIKFYMHGDELDPSATLLRVLQSREEPSGNNKALNMKYIWENAHQIDFRISKVSDAVEPASTLIGAQESGLPRQTVGQSLNSILEEEDPNVLHTISILETIERTIRLDSPGQQQVHILGSARMPIKSLLTNSKLSSKLMKQMKDPLLVCSKIMPEWCSVLPIVAKFLFSFDLRKKYFRYHAFGLGRTLLAMLEDAAPPGNSAPVDEDLPLRMPRIPRQKVRISRCHILESARKVFDRYANKNSRLEVEFYNEAGSGLGPTLEFYTLLSTELQRKDLCMWRDIGTGQNSNEQKVTDNSLEKAHYKQPGLKALDLVTAPFGLFPRPMQTEKSDEKKCEKILQNFRLLGQSMAKAIQDDRLMDIPLSRPFYKFIITGALEPADLSYIDPSLAKYLEDILSGCGSSQVLVNGVPIDDLCLSFVLPGDEEYELCPGGKDISVSSETAEQYVNSLYDALLDTGVRAQIESFKSGFSDIFSPDNLRIFYEEEIEDLVCGDSGKGKWTKPSLSSAIKCDHGYSADSPAVTALVNVLSEFDTKDQQLFLKFVTGAPRLPAGGFGSLNPKLTVVKKAPDVPSSLKESPLSPHSKDKMIRDLADKDLPSVMTCANYLKLPPYSSENILRDRLLYAIREGQGSFDLS
jgi:E3 ubiquitin-protein ligase TRIP12